MPASSAAKFTDKTDIFCFVVVTFTSTAEKNEASSSNFAESAITRYKPALHMERFNYYVVRKGYNCGMYFN